MHRWSFESGKDEGPGPRRTDPKLRPDARSAGRTDRPGNYDAGVTAPSLIDSDVLERVLSASLAKGGDMAEVFAEDRQTSSAILDDRRIEELSSGRERGAGIRVVVGETTGFAHTADLSETGLLAAAEAAAAVARRGGGGTKTVASRPVGPHRIGAQCSRPRWRNRPSSSSCQEPMTPLVRPAARSPRSRSAMAIADAGS